MMLRVAGYCSIDEAIIDLQTADPEAWATAEADVSRLHQKQP